MYLDAIRLHSLPKASLNFDGFCDGFLTAVTTMWPNEALHPLLNRVIRQCLGK